MKEPLLVIDGRLADRFDIDPSEILPNPSRLARLKKRWGITRMQK